MQLVWQQFACMKTAIGFLCRSVCVCVCVFVCFEAGKSPSREASVLKRPSVERACTSSARLCMHTRTQTLADAVRCLNAPMHIAACRYCSKSQRGCVQIKNRVHVKTYARFRNERDQQTTPTPRHILGPCTWLHKHTQTHTNMRAHSSEQMKREGMMRTAEEHSVFSEPCRAVVFVI